MTKSVRQVRRGDVFRLPGQVRPEDFVALSDPWSLGPHAWLVKVGLSVPVVRPEAKEKT